jgi:HlyD family secretion protein
MIKNSSIIVGVTILLMVLIMSVVGWLAFKPVPTILQGEVEATEISVATKLTGRMEQLNVKEGQQVLKGDTLLTLYSPEVMAKLVQAKAVRSAAGAQNLKAGNGARVEQISGAKNVWLKATAAAQLAEKTFARVKNLYDDGVLPEQKRDEAETQMRAAQLTADAAKANYDMAMAGTRSEDKMAAHALEQQAEGAISEVLAFLDETIVCAPLSGEVAQINANVGELVTAGFPVVNIVNLDDVWFTFNIREDFLHKFVMDKTFEVSVPALENKTIELKINYIHARGDYATWRATKASGDFDKKMFEVRAIPTQAIENLRPGMSALVEWDKLQ